ncbi:MAG: prephenate dehydratase [Verrucomicrobia bacterium]|nr:prephenate dehydratase [Verrucomicrobiota bacterium]
MVLRELRQKIDALDDRLIALLNERADLVHAVGELKRTQGLEIYAPEREEALLGALTAKNAAHGGRLPAAGLRAIYREIMSASLALEKDLAIAYLGPPATWTHQAARAKFGASVRYAPQPGIADVFDAVARGRADYGVVPIENSTEGAVNHTLDVFIESDLRICAQILLKIENHLLARVRREAIHRLYSHPQVFGQCRNWLRANFPTAELIEVSSTSRAGELAAQAADAAALGGQMVAELHGLFVLEHSVQDQPNNATRFLVIGPSDCPPTGKDKTSLLFGVSDEAGALLSALEPFRQAGISLSKIESRPSKRKPWEYVFFVDAQCHAQDAPMVAALGGLRQRCSFLKILGSYPNVTG